MDEEDKIANSNRNTVKFENNCSRIDPADLTDTQAIMNDYLRTHGPKNGLASTFEPKTNISLGKKILHNKKLAKVLINK